MWKNTLSEDNTVTVSTQAWDHAQPILEIGRKIQSNLPAKGGASTQIQVSSHPGGREGYSASSSLPYPTPTTTSAA